jgi:hypothetical protein
MADAVPGTRLCVVEDGLRGRGSAITADVGNLWMTLAAAAPFVNPLFDGSFTVDGAP